MLFQCVSNGGKTIGQTRADSPRPILVTPLRVLLQVRWEQILWNGDEEMDGYDLKGKPM